MGVHIWSSLTSLSGLLKPARDTLYTVIINEVITANWRMKWVILLSFAGLAVGFPVEDDEECLGFGGMRVHMHNKYGYLTHCSNHLCGSSVDNRHPDSLSLERRPNGDASVWRLIHKDGKCALKAENGMFSTLCRGCMRRPYSSYVNEYGVFLHNNDSTNPAALWVMGKSEYGDGRYTLRDSSRQRYLSACEGCVRDSEINNMALALDEFGTAEYSTWLIEPVAGNTSREINEEPAYGERKYLASPNYPFHYYNNEYQQWHLESQNGGTFELEILDMDLETNYDFLNIYDGENSEDPRLAQFTGHQEPSSIFSTGSHVFVVFTSDSTETDTGFKIRYREKEIESVVDCDARCGENAHCASKTSTSYNSWWEEDSTENVCLCNDGFIGNPNIQCIDRNDDTIR